jgi:hypothetical protein
VSGRGYERVRSKVARRGKRELGTNESKGDVRRLKSPSIKSARPSSGNEVIKVSSSLRNSLRHRIPN